MAHSLHTLAPVASWYVPFLQSTDAVMPLLGQLPPAGQGLHVTPDEAPRNVPAAQGVHVSPVA